MNAFTVLFSDGPDIRIRDAPIDHIHHPEQPTLPPGCRDFWGNVVGAFDAQCNVGLHGFLWRERDQRHILLLIKKNCFFKCVDKDLKTQLHNCTMHKTVNFKITNGTFEIPRLGDVIEVYNYKSFFKSMKE